MSISIFGVVAGEDIIKLGYIDNIYIYIYAWIKIYYQSISTQPGTPFVVIIFLSCAG